MTFPLWVIFIMAHGTMTQVDFTPSYGTSETCNKQLREKIRSGALVKAPGIQYICWPIGGA